MKTLFLAFKNCPTFLTLTSLTSFVLFVCNVFWWMKLDPIFEAAPKIGEIANTIFTSIITGHIFYAIVNQIKENKDKENIRSVISKGIEEINYQNGLLFDEFIKISNYVPKKLPFELGEIKSILNELETIQSPPSIVNGYPKPVNWTWFQLMQSSRQKVKTEINKLLRFSSLLDTKFLGLLDRIERSSYFEMIDQTSIFGKDFKQFSIFTDSYLKHQDINIEMIKYGLKENWLIISDKQIKSMLENMVTIGIDEAEINEMIRKNKA